MLQTLKSPETIVDLSPQSMELMIRQARRTQLLGVLAHRLEANGCLTSLPAPARDVFLAGRVRGGLFERMLDWESRQLQTVLQRAGITPIFLKGAAYRALRLPLGAGRAASDVDILIGEDRLEETEAALKEAGWDEVKTAEYEQQYYRKWMHELPPLRHRLRRTLVDVHRSIIPPTARLKPDAGRLIAASVTAGDTGLHVLCPEDMVLHNVVHHFYNGELDNSLRELVDLDAMLRTFGTTNGFWERLVPRARELDLLRPLYYGLHFTRTLLDTPIPAAVVEMAERGRPGAPVRLLMQGLVSRVLTPAIPGRRDWRRAIAAWLLYVRSHWIRMPPLLLLRHLTIKAGMRWRKAQGA